MTLLKLGIHFGPILAKKCGAFSWHKSIKLSVPRLRLFFSNNSKVVACLYQSEIMTFQGRLCSLLFFRLFSGFKKHTFLTGVLSKMDTLRLDFISGFISQCPTNDNGKEKCNDTFHYCFFDVYIFHLPFIVYTWNHINDIIWLFIGNGLLLVNNLSIHSLIINALLYRCTFDFIVGVFKH